MTYCKECLNKQQKINKLEEEIASLKTKLRYQERTAEEGFFGSSTPCSGKIKGVRYNLGPPVAIPLVLRRAAERIVPVRIGDDYVVHVTAVSDAHQVPIAEIVHSEGLVAIGYSILGEGSAVND